MTAAIPVKQTAEDRLGVEAGKAQPVDAAIQPDQGHSGPVSDQPEILKWRVILADPDKPEGRIGIEHDADIPSPMSALAIIASIISTHRNYITQKESASSRAFAAASWQPPDPDQQAADALIVGLAGARSGAPAQLNSAGSGYEES
jgi:hypothetical protein